MRLICVVLLVCAATSMASVNSEPVFFDNSVGPIGSPRYLEMRQSNLPAGQTFTVGLSGFLDHIDIQLSKSSDLITEGVTLNVYPVTAAGKPDLSGSPLATGSAGTNVIPLNLFHADSEYVRFDVSAAALVVIPGEHLAAMITTAQPTPPQYIWTASAEGANLYDGGDAWFRNSITGELMTNTIGNPPYDMMFRTYVQLPEPATGALAVSFLGLIMRRRRTVR